MESKRSCKHIHKILVQLFGLLLIACGIALVIVALSPNLIQLLFWS